jgi:fatty acid desaturase
LKIGMLSTFIIGVSHLRTLTSHRFRNAGEEMSYVEQLLDSTTIPGGPIWTELWCPIGMRYHALHHLVPSLPYHNMAEAHRRVMEAFPFDNPYRRTIRNGLIDALRDLVGSFWEARRGSRKLPEQRDRAAA